MFESTDPSPREIERQKKKFQPELPLRGRRARHFERWARIRQQNLLIRAAKNAHRLAVCSCGCHKAMSANFCCECQEARQIIRNKTKPLVQHNYQLDAQRLSVTELRQCTLTPNYATNKEPIAFEQDNGFDDLVRLYEDCQ